MSNIQICKRKAGKKQGWNTEQRVISAILKELMVKDTRWHSSLRSEGRNIREKTFKSTGVTKEILRLRDILK